MPPRRQRGAHAGRQGYKLVRAAVPDSGVGPDAEAVRASIDMYGLDGAAIAFDITTEDQMDQVRTLAAAWIVSRLMLKAGSGVPADALPFRVIVEVQPLDDDSSNPNGAA